MKCIHCNKPLVPIGSKRKNGKNHSDWKGRDSHKKCHAEWVQRLLFKQFLVSQ